MPLVAVLCLVLLFLAALGQSWWWRGQNPVWYGDALYYWGVFLLALCILWPTVKGLAHS